MTVEDTIADLEAAIKRPLTDIEKLIARNVWHDAKIDSISNETDRLIGKQVPNV